MRDSTETSGSSPVCEDHAGGSLQSLLDERACAQVVQRYGALADGDDANGFVDLFTPDAVWQRPDGTVYQGHDQIRSVYEGRPRQGNSHHLICNVTVQLCGSEAMAESTTVLLKSPSANSTAATVAVARYIDTLLRCSDGRWRIARRSSTRLFNFPSGDGGV